MCSVKTAILYTLVYCAKPELNPHPAVVPVKKKNISPLPYPALSCNCSYSLRYCGLCLAMPAVLPPEFAMLCASLFSLYNAGFVVLSCKPHFQQQVQQQQHPTTQTNHQTHQRNANINDRTNATDIGGG